MLKKAFQLIFVLSLCAIDPLSLRTIDPLSLWNDNLHASTAWAADTDSVNSAAEANEKITIDKNETESSKKTDEAPTSFDSTKVDARPKNATQTDSEDTSDLSSRDMRKNVSYFVLGTYSPLDMLIPSKTGATIGYVPSAEKSWELEYIKGSVSLPPLIEDIGEMSDQRISLIRRSYSNRNSFYWSAGLSYFDFKVYVGDELLNRITAGTFPSIDLVRVQSLGFHTSVGNRWMFGPNVVVGVDWISLSQPIYTIDKESAILDYATNPKDREDIEDAVDVIAYFPRLALLKLQIGIAF
jgi:hypothetical protein